MYALARVVEERLSPLLSESIHRIYPIPIRDFKRPLALAGQLHVLEPLGSTTRRSLKAKQKVGCQPSIITWMSRWPKPGVRLLKEVIQPQVPLRLPCYDFTPVADLAVGAPLLKGWGHDFGRGQLPWCDGRCVQGPGTYSPQHADLRLLAIPASWSRVADSNPY